MEFSARQIAEVLNGKVEGNPDVLISKLAKIEEGSPGRFSVGAMTAAERSRRGAGMLH